MHKIRLLTEILIKHCSLYILIYLDKMHAIFKIQKLLILLTLIPYLFHYHIP